MFLSFVLLFLCLWIERGLLWRFGRGGGFCGLFGSGCWEAGGFKALPAVAPALNNCWKRPEHSFFVVAAGSALFFFAALPSHHKPFCLSPS